jgi:hypothetical protein
MDHDTGVEKSQDLSVKHGGELPIFHLLDASRSKGRIFIHSTGKRKYIMEWDD